MKRRPLCLLCLLVMVCVTAFAFLGIPLRPERQGDKFLQKCCLNGTAATAAGYVENSGSSEEYSWCLLSGVECRCGAKILPAGRIRLTFKGSREIPPGALMRISGTPSLFSPATNPGQFDPARNAKIQKIAFVIKNPSVLSLRTDVFSFHGEMMRIRGRFRERICDVYPSDEAGILCAMLLGDREMLDDDTRALWQYGGISHMLAISGLHLTILGMGLFKLLRKCRMRLRPASAVCLSFLFLYCLFTGMSVSTVRAFLMFCLLLGARLAGRTYDPPTALAAAALLILLENPYMVMSPAFLLSFGAVLLTCFFQKRSTFIVALMFYLGMMPLVLCFFSEVPLYSIPVNLAAVPLLPAILLLGMAGMAFGKRFPWMAIPDTFLLHALKKTLEICRNLPHSSLILGKPSLWQILLYLFLLVCFCLLMYRFRNEKKRMLVLILVPVLVAVFAWHPRPGLRMVFLDVGQGDSCIIESRCKTDILVDCGSSSTLRVGKMRLIPALKAEGVSRLRYVFLTHMDADHINGAEELLTEIADRKTSIRVGTVVFPYLAHPGDTYRKMWKLAEKAGASCLTVRKGDRFLADGIRLSVMNPDPLLEKTEMGGSKEEEIDENGQCIVLKVTFGRFDALMTGDVHGEAEEAIGKDLGKTSSSIEVLKVAHHGSGTSTPDSFLKEVKPKTGIISVGAGNRYGHPKPELLSRLEKYRVRILRTDQCGAVTVETDGSRYYIRTFRENCRGLFKS